jgi:kynurenine formamidase
MYRIRPITYLICGLLLSYGCAEKQRWASGRWIDLTHDFSAETVYWPTAENFKLDTVFAGFTDKGYYYSAYNFCAAEHGGTHIDAPVHFAEGHKTVEEISLQQLIGPAVVIDVSRKALKDRDYQVRVEDFTGWEAKFGTIPDNSIILLRTGSGKFWPDRQTYMGTEERGQEAVSKLHFPGLHPEAAQWLVKNRNISAIGLDTPSIDYGQSQLFESHQILFDQNIPVFENVAQLDQLPEKGSFVIALPMKIKGGSGGPLRIIAFLPQQR